MKPSEKQIQFLKKIAHTIDFITNTNDINSPTHYGDLQETAKQLSEEFGLTENMGEELGDAFTDIYILCKKVQLREAIELNNSNSDTYHES